MPNAAPKDVPYRVALRAGELIVHMLLAIGPRPRREATFLYLDGQVHHDTHAIPTGNYDLLNPQVQYRRWPSGG
jgi:hypothetical protein